MATTVTKVVDPDMGSGYDYDSLYDWEAAQQGDLTIRDEIAVASYRPSSGAADTTACVISGWTVSSTQYVKVTAASGYEAEMPWSGNAHIQAASNVIQVVDAAYTIIEKLKIYLSSTDVNTWASCIEFDPVGCVARYNIVRGTTSDVNRKIGILTETDATGGLVYRNVAYRFNSTLVVSPARGFANNNGSATTVYAQNIAFNCARGFSTYNQGITIKQNYTGDCGACYYEVTNAVSSKNISSDSTSPDGASYRGKNSYSDYFVDYANRDFHLKSTDTVLKDAGDDLGSPYNTDFDGEAVTGTWDIGADEYVAISSNPTMTISETLTFAEALD